MPWTGSSFAAKHNKKLKGAVADSAARQASAMVRSGVDEGIAIATANKRANKLRKRGLISDRAHAKMNEKARKLKGYADGGDPPVGKPSIVGENGPEVFIPKQPGTIVPNKNTPSSPRSGEPRPFGWPPHIPGWF